MMGRRPLGERASKRAAVSGIWQAFTVTL